MTSTIHNMINFYTIHTYVLTILSVYNAMWLFICKFLVLKQFFVSLCDKSLSTIATDIDLRLIEVDVDLWVTEGPSPTVTPRVVALHNHYRLLCYQVYRKFFINL